MTTPSRSAHSNTPPNAGALLTLVIENANPGSVLGAGDLGPASVALGWIDQSEATLIHAEAIGASTRSEDDLVSAIARCCDHAAVDRRQIRRVGVDIGPGGYTALRMAVAATKMIALVTGAGCVGVPSAEVCIESLREAPADGASAPTRGGAPERPIIVVLATKGASAYVTRWPSAEPGQVMTWADVRSSPGFSSALLLMDEHAPAEWHKEAGSLGAAVRPPRFDAVSLLRCVARSASTDQLTDAGSLAPLYAREPEAVTIWRQRKDAQKR